MHIYIYIYIYIYISPCHIQPFSHTPSLFPNEFIFDDDKNISDARKMGITDLNKKYELNEIVKGDSIFCATGITTSDVLSGINIKDNKYTSETLVTHKSSNFKEIIKRIDLVKE